MSNQGKIDQISQILSNTTLTFIQSRNLIKFIMSKTEKKKVIAVIASDYQEYRKRLKDLKLDRKKCVWYRGKKTEDAFLVQKIV